MKLYVLWYNGEIKMDSNGKPSVYNSMRGANGALAHYTSKTIFRRNERGEIEYIPKYENNKFEIIEYIPVNVPSDEED